MSLEEAIKSIISSEISKLNRSDLVRDPLISFSSAHDARYAELKTIIGDWHLSPTELLPTANSVISYFVPFTKEVAVAPRNAAQAAPLWGESYIVINPYFADVNEVVCEYLIKLGHDAIAIPATHTYDPREMKSMWSHRSAAAIAGLGSFGRNRMLITDKGSAGRFCTVLTSADLQAEERTPAIRCSHLKNGSCGLCFSVCPAQALHAESLDKFACQAETQKNEKLLEQNANLQNADICGKCVSICPHSYIA